MLKLARDLSLPLDAVSRTFGILAVRGAGKSNTAAVMAEEMFAAHLPFCVVDPVGSWYGLRSSADGTKPGLPIPIFGGKHGDVPLERGAGELVADLIVEKRLTCVLDLSRFGSEGDKKTFLLAFARRLYERNEDPLHLFLEEADDYIPQKPMRDEAQLLRAWENIVRRGRARGLGMTLITQRSAAVAKMVLTQVETLFAMRTTGPQDIAAIEAWVKYHQTGSEVLASLAGLADGEAWVWSPHFLKTMSRHQIRRRRTFDSGATPTNVHAKDKRPPATLADIDLAALQGRMAATIEKAKADDPRELRKQIAELKRELAKGAAQADTKKEPIRQVEKPALTDADRKLLETLGDRMRQVVEFLDRVKAQAVQEIADAVRVATAELVASDATARDAFVKQLDGKGLQKVLDKLAAVPSVERSPNSVGQPAKAPRTRPHVGSSPTLSATSTDLPPGEKAVLTAALQYSEGLDRKRLGVLTGYKRSSRDAYINRLASRGFVAVDGACIFPTDAGQAALGDAFEPLPTGTDLVAYWRERLPEGERRTLEVLLAARGKGVARETIDEQTGYKRSSRDAYLVRLKARGLVEFASRGMVRASEELTES